MWHSHNEREITTNNIFPGGMLMMMLVDSAGICHRRVQLIQDTEEKAMRFDHSKATLRTVLLAVCILLLGASWAAAQQQVNLTAGPTSDYLTRRFVSADVGLQLRRCGGRVDCKLRQAEPLSRWMVASGDHRAHGSKPADQSDQQSGLWPATGKIPTSLTIVGQLGGGLGRALPPRPVRRMTCKTSHGPLRAVILETGRILLLRRGRACSRSRPKLRRELRPTLPLGDPARGHVPT